MVRRKKISMAQPMLLSVTDVAAQMSVCRQTVYNYIYHEGLPSIKVRGLRRVRSDALQEWLKGYEKQGA
jgi:excisionase family DNA binding protein